MVSSLLRTSALISNPRHVLSCGSMVRTTTRRRLHTYVEQVPDRLQDRQHGLVVAPGRCRRRHGPRAAHDQLDPLAVERVIMRDGTVLRILNVSSRGSAYKE